MLDKLREKQKQEEDMLQELEGLQRSLRADKQSLAEVTNDRDKLRSLCDEKDKALQVKVLTLHGIILILIFALLTCLNDYAIY